MSWILSHWSKYALLSHDLYLSSLTHYIITTSQSNFRTFSNLRPVHDLLTKNSHHPPTQPTLYTPPGTSQLLGFLAGQLQPGNPKIHLAFGFNSSKTKTSPFPCKVNGRWGPAAGVPCLSFPGKMKQMITGNGTTYLINFISRTNPLSLSLSLSLSLHLSPSADSEWM